MGIYRKLRNKFKGKYSTRRWLKWIKLKIKGE